MNDNRLDQVLLEARPDDLPPAPVIRRHLRELRRHAESARTKPVIIDIEAPLPARTRAGRRRSPILVAALVLVIAGAGWLAIHPGGGSGSDPAQPPAGAGVTAAASASRLPVVVSDDPGFEFRSIRIYDGTLQAGWTLDGVQGDIYIFRGTRDDYLASVLTRAENDSTLGILGTRPGSVMGFEATFVDVPDRPAAIWWGDGYVFEFAGEFGSLDDLIRVSGTLRPNPDLNWADLGASIVTVEESPPTTAAPTTTVVAVPPEAGEFPPVVSSLNSGQQLSYTSVEFTPAGGIAATWTSAGTEGFLEIRPGDEGALAETVGSLQAVDPDSAILATDLEVMGRQATIVGGGYRSAVAWIKEGFVFVLGSDRAGPDELSALAQTLVIASDWTWADWAEPAVQPERQLLQSGKLGSSEWQVVRWQRRGDPSWCLQVTPFTESDWFCLSPGNTYGDPILTLRPVAVARGGVGDPAAAPAVLMVGVFSDRVTEVRLSGDRYGPASVHTLAFDDGYRMLAFGVDDLADGEQLVVEALDSDQQVIGRAEFTGPLTVGG